MIDIQWTADLPCCDRCPAQRSCDPSFCLTFAEHLSDGGRQETEHGTLPGPAAPAPIVREAYRVLGAIPSHEEAARYAEWLERKRGQDRQD